MANEIATPRDGVNNLKTMKLAHAAAVLAGEIIVANGNILVAVNAADANVENIYVYRGRVGFPKATGVSTAIAANAKVYWDATNGVATVDAAAGANKMIGTTVEAAGDTDVEVLAMLGEN